MKQNIILLILTSIFLIGCFPKPTDYNGKYPSKVAAEKNIKMAKKAIEKDYYEEAYTFLDFVKAKYPYELEAQEQVKVTYGDIFFRQGKYIDAISVYQSFIKIHPSSKFVPYAQFKIAKSYYNDMPMEFFLFPPPYERDRESIIYAKKALMFYLGNFPKSKDAPEAKKMLQKTIDYLANYQFYVGNFYYKKGKYKGAARRFENVITEHPNSSYVKESIYKATLSYIKVKDGVNALKYKNLFTNKYPGSEKLNEINQKFNKLQVENPSKTDKTAIK